VTHQFSRIFCWQATLVCSIARCRPLVPGLINQPGSLPTCNICESIRPSQPGFFFCPEQQSQPASAARGGGHHLEAGGYIAEISQLSPLSVQHSPGVSRLPETPSLGEPRLDPAALLENYLTASLYFFNFLSNFLFQKIFQLFLQFSFLGPPFAIVSRSFFNFFLTFFRFFSFTFFLFLFLSFFIFQSFSIYFSLIFFSRSLFSLSILFFSLSFSFSTLFFFPPLFPPFSANPAH